MTVALALLRRASPYLIVAALATGTAYGFYRHGVSVERQHWQTEWAKRDASDAEARAAAELAQRTEEQRRADWAAGVQRDAIQELERVRTDADGAAADNGRLRNELANLQARLGRTGQGAATPVSCASTTRAAMVLSQLLEGSSRREQELAKAFDGARVAGLTCERAYDGLTIGSPDTNK